MNPYIEKVVLVTLTMKDFSHKEKIEFFEPREPNSIYKDLEKTSYYKYQQHNMKDYRKGFLTIYEILRIVNTRYPNRIAIVTNNDISFDHSLVHMARLKRDEFWTISRRETVYITDTGILMPLDENSKDQFFYYGGSHDAFIFHSPLHVKKDILHESLVVTRTMGSPGVENVWNYLAQHAGRILMNPCRTIVLTHHHEVRIPVWCSK